MRAKSWLLLAMVVVVGCSIPDTSQRGFGSKQVLHVRDDALGLRVFSVDLSAIYLAHEIPDIKTSNGASQPYDRTLLDLATGTETLIETGVLVAYTLGDASGPGRSLVMTHFPSDATIPANLTSNNAPPFVTLTVLDEMTGTTVDVPNVNDQYLSLGATRADPMVVGRADTDGTSTLPWVGMPNALVQLPSDVNVVVGRDHQGFVALTAGPDDPTQAFTRYPFDTPTVPAVITPGVLDSRGVISSDDGMAMNTGTATLPLSDVTPAIYCPAPLAGQAVPSCLLFYDRDFADGTSAGFLHDLDGARDLQLPGALSNHLANVMSLSATGQDMFWLNDEGGVQTRVYSWHIGDARAASCVVPRTPDRRNFSLTAWQPGQPGTTATRFATVTQSNSQSLTSPGSWALLEGTAGVPCQLVTSGNNQIQQMQFSPAGDQLALLESDAVGNSTVYLGAPDGTAPAVAATGSYFFNIDYHDARHLLLWHSNTDGYSLSYLDVSTVPAVEHAIADRVRWDARASWAWLTPQWVLLADADLQQDGSYALDVVNIDTGEERLVSRGVVDFRVSWFTPPPGATELAVAYTVRSRTESSQDGIWVAHLPLAEFAN